MAGQKSLEEWEAMFRDADKDGNGLLDIMELRDMLRKGNSNVTDSQIADAFVYLEGGPTKVVTFDAFVKGMQNFELFYAKLGEHFKKYDADNNGYLDKEELRQLLCGSGHKFTDEEVDAILISADKSGDGKISFQEFLEACT